MTATNRRSDLRHESVTRALDRVGAITLWALYVYWATVAVFSRREYYDTVAYALPGANLIASGALSLPQLGSQYGLDRFWLFNAPFMVLGEIPAFLVAGIGRIQYLVPIVVLALGNLWAVATVCKRVLALRSVALSTLIAFAFLGTRGLATSDLYNQRYAVAAFGLMTLAFAPLTQSSDERPRWWQWLAAGLVPLFHPLLALASVAFALDAVRRRQVSRAGAVWFAGCFIAGAAWYGRVTAFTTQFFVHMRYGYFRAGTPFAGVLDAAASPLAAVPTELLTTAVAIGAFLVVALATRSQEFGKRYEALAVPAGLILVVVAADALRGFQYAGYYLIGLGPALLAAAVTPPMVRQGATIGLTLVALANVGVAGTLDRSSPDWTTTRATRLFLMAHTRPGDRLVLGPPFVLVASTGIEGRQITRVVPQPYFLEPFDRAAFVQDIAGSADVYVGTPEWYLRPVWTQAPIGGLFETAETERLEFNGQPVVVIRRTP